MKEEQDDDVTEGRAVYLMIKVYPSGAVSPQLALLNPGDSVSMSGSGGEFQMSLLKDVTHLIMFCAGTGMTPMIRLTYHAIFEDQDTSFQQVHLITYQKKMCDIIWREKLEIMAEDYERFCVTYVLSDEDTSEWDGLKGRVCEQHIKDFVPHPSTPSQPFSNSSASGEDTTSNSEIPVIPLVCVCGPPAYTVAVAKLLRAYGLANTNIHLFQG